MRSETNGGVEEIESGREMFFSTDVKEEVGSGPQNPQPLNIS